MKEGAIKAGIVKDGTINPGTAKDGTTKDGTTKYDTVGANASESRRSVQLRKFLESPNWLVGYWRRGKRWEKRLTLNRCFNFWLSRASTTGARGNTIRWALGKPKTGSFQA